MSKKKRKRSKSPGVVIDVDDVSADTKLKDLTVAQFIEVLMQANAQMRRPRPQSRAAASEGLDETVQKIQELIGKRDPETMDQAEVKALVEKAQQVILADMPDAMRRPA